MTDRHFKHKILLWCVVYGKGIGCCCTLTYWSISTDRECCNINIIYNRRCYCCCIVNHILVHCRIGVALIISDRHTETLSIICCKVISCLYTKRCSKCHSYRWCPIIITRHTCYKVRCQSSTITHYDIHRTGCCCDTCAVWIFCYHHIRSSTPLCHTVGQTNFIT